LFCGGLPKNQSNFEYSKQVIRSSASVGANYIEANEALGRKDFLMRLRISRKEARETAYWLRLIVETNEACFKGEARELINESLEFVMIFSSIINKLK